MNCPYAEGVLDGSEKCCIDIDVIILAHWYLLRKEYPSRYLVIATTNIRHFEGFAEALNWEDINLS